MVKVETCQTFKDVHRQPELVERSSLQTQVSQSQLTWKLSQFDPGLGIYAVQPCPIP
jgi:hypothetical protein